MSYRPWMFALVIAATLGVVAATSGTASAQVKPPADFKFDAGKDSPGPVTFSHEEHKERVGGCTACHVKIFKMKKGADAPLTMEQDEERAAVRDLPQRDDGGQGQGRLRGDRQGQLREVS